MIIVYGQVFNMFGKEYHNRDVAKQRAKGARAVEMGNIDSSCGE